MCQEHCSESDSAGEVRSRQRSASLQCPSVLSRRGSGGFRIGRIRPAVQHLTLLNSFSIFCRSKTKALRACSDDLSVSTRTNTERLRVAGAHPNNQMRGTDMVAAIIARACGWINRTERLGAGLCWRGWERDSLALAGEGMMIKIERESSIQ